MYWLSVLEALSMELDGRGGSREQNRCGLGPWAADPVTGEMDRQ